MIPLSAPIAASVSTDIETLARALAATDPAQIDRVVADHVAIAVREHRIEDAVRWQRVRLRARGMLLRRNGYFAAK